MRNSDDDYLNEDEGFDAWVNTDSNHATSNDGNHAAPNQASEDSEPVGASPDDYRLPQPADAGNDLDTESPHRSAGSSSLYNCDSHEYSARSQHEHGSQSQNRYRYIPRPPRGQKRKPRGELVKTVTLTIFVILLIIASAVIFMDDKKGQEDYAEWLPPTRAPYEFFSPPAAQDLPEVIGSIPRAENGGGTTLEFEPIPDGGVLSKQEVYAKCSPWVVAISASATSGGGYYWGSGIVMTHDGYILTNNHIIEGSRSVMITLYDDSEYEALLVGTDVRSDIAVLKIDAENLPFARFADSTVLEVGEDVVAIGNPLGKEFRSTLTNGIISSISRDIRYENYKMNVLQTTAAVNEGNSGGPLINMYGQVIGITNMKMISYNVSIEGIAFAIPTSSMKSVVDELIEQGYVSGRPAIGITPGDIPMTAKDYFALPEGLYVKNVNINSDAFTKGIRTGDVIIAAQGEDVLTALDLNNIKDRFNVGDTLTLTIYRNGETFDVGVVLCDMVDLDG